MSPAGRASGLVLVGLEGPTLQPREAELLRAHEVAGVVLFRRNVLDLDQLRRLCASIVDAVVEGSGPPPLIAADHEGGNVSVLASAISAPPSALCLGIADDLELTQRVHRETARRASDAGVGLLLAPVADVVAVDNPVISTRAFGTDAASVRRHARAAVVGIHEGGATACAKHWPGHGRPRVDSHVTVPTVDAPREDWARHDLPPFLSVIEAGVDAVMVGHLHVPALDRSGAIATVSRTIVEDWLRGRVGFEGAVITDALEMGGFAGQSPASAIAAGCDLLLFASPIVEASARLAALERELASGTPTSRLEAARARVDRLRRRGATRETDPSAHGDTLTARPTPEGPASGVEGVYAEARRRGLVALGFDSREATWPPAATAPVRWGLVDAASGDRLVRQPRPGEDPFELRPGDAAAGPYLSVLERHLGPPSRSPLRLVPGAEAPPELSPRQESSPAVDGWIVVSVRPFPGPARESLARYLLAAAPRWVALLGDLSLQTVLPGEVSLVLVPGATGADAEILAHVLTGRIPLEAQGRWGD